MHALNTCCVQKAFDLFTLQQKSSNYHKTPFPPLPSISTDSMRADRFANLTIMFVIIFYYSYLNNYILGCDQDMAATCLFLACKSEETLRRTQDMLKVVIRVAMKRPTMAIDLQGKEYQRWAELILRQEDTLMQTLCFDFVVPLPHSKLDVLLQRLLDASDIPLTFEDRRIVTVVASLWLNDSLRAPCCLFHGPETQVAAALLLSCEFYLTQCRLMKPFEDLSRNVDQLTSWSALLQVDAAAVQRTSIIRRLFCIQMTLL